MPQSFRQLFLMHLRLVYRDRTGLFFTLLMPSVIYVALSILPIGRVTGGQASYSNFVLPGIVAMTVMQGGIYGLAYWMVDLKARGVIKRFLVTPLKQSELVLSLLSARILVALLQVAVLTFIGVVFFNATFVWNVLSVILIVALGGATFLLVGLLISMFADSYQAAAPITAAIGLPLTFLGNIFFPVEGLPHALKIFAQLLPITYMADALRALYTQPFQFNLIGKDVLIMSAWFIALLGLILWRFRLSDEG